MEVSTECGHCGRPLHLVLDSQGGYRVEEEEAEPLVFQPEVDWRTFSKPTIIDDY